MKVLKLIQELIDLHKARGNIDVILQADHYGYDDARGCEYTLYDGDEGTYDCPEEAPDDVREVIVVYV